MITDDLAVKGEESFTISIMFSHFTTGFLDTNMGAINAPNYVGHAHHIEESLLRRKNLFSRCWHLDKFGSVVSQRYNEPLHNATYCRLTDTMQITCIIIVILK